MKVQAQGFFPCMYKTNKQTNKGEKKTSCEIIYAHQLINAQSRQQVELQENLSPNSGAYD
jgi:hypothetical protein